MSSELVGESLAIVSAIFWAIGANVYKKGLENTDIWSGNLMRTGFTSLGFLVFMLVKGNLLQSIQALNASLFLWLFISGFFAFFAGDILYLASLREIGVARAVPLSSTYPLFVAILAFLIYGEKVGFPIISGTLFILIAIRLISEDEGTVRSKRGFMFAILAAICWSISITILEYLTHFLASEAIAGFRFLIVFFLLFIVVERRGFNFNRSSAFWIGFGGMIILVTSNYTFVEAIRMIGPAKVAPISSSYPVISAFFAAIFLRERLTTRIILGTILSVVGVITIVAF
jgi:drug/metabolite transporter (DMT)-like permease